MSAADGFRDGMRTDHELERALAGEAPPSALTALVDDLRSLADATVGEPTAHRHVAAAAAAAREGKDRAGVVVPLPRDRAPRRGGAVVRGALAAAVVVAVVLSLASAGFLPTPVQAAVADIAARVGLNLPDPDRGGEQLPDPDPDPDPAPDPDPGPAPAPGGAPDSAENETGTPGDTPPVPPTAAPPATPDPPPAGRPEPPAGIPAPPSGPPTGSPAETPPGPPAGTPSAPLEETPGPPNGNPRP